MKRILGLLTLSLVITALTINITGNFARFFVIKSFQALSSKKPQHVVLDSLGVPWVWYEGKLGRQRNPVNIAETALKYYADTSAASHTAFFHCAHWIDSASVSLNDSSLIWYNSFPWSQYRLVAPWRSAMSQGRIAQVYLRAFRLTADSQYLHKAKKAINTLFTEVKDGGVTYKDSTGWWYEEYAGDHAEESRVLNGMIVVLLALPEFNQYTSDTVSLFLFNKGALSVEHNLYRYNDKGHSSYDALGHPASSWYHHFHISLLDSMYAFTGNKLFATYHTEWKRYREPSFLSLFIAKPTKIYAFTALVDFLLVLFIVFSFSWLFRKYFTK